MQKLNKLKTIPLTAWFQDREKYLPRDLTRVDVCLALLRGRPPGDVVCISGGYYRYRLRGEEGEAGAVIKVNLTALHDTPAPRERTSPLRDGYGIVEEDEEEEEEGKEKEFAVPVPGLYGYGVRFLAISDKHLLLQSYSGAYAGATATVLFDLISGEGRGVDEIPEMSEYVSSPTGEFFLCRDSVRRPCAAWLWWAHTGQRQLLELATYQARPERIIIDPRPSHSHLLYYITCTKETNQGFLTRYDTSSLSHSIIDGITLSTDLLVFTSDCSCLLGIQRYPVNFVSIAPDTMELQRSICYHSYSPMDGLPLSFPTVVDAFLEAEITNGLQASLVVNTRSKLCGRVVAPDSCVVLIPVFERTGNSVAIVHLHMADQGQTPNISRVDLYHLKGTNQMIYADAPGLGGKKTDHNHNLKGMVALGGKLIPKSFKSCLKSKVKEASKEQLLAEKKKRTVSSYGLNDLSNGIVDDDEEGLLPERFRRKSAPTGLRSQRGNTM